MEKHARKKNVVTLDGNLRIAASIFFYLFKSLIILHLCTVIIHLEKKYELRIAGSMRLTAKSLFSSDAHLGRDRRNESARVMMGSGLFSLPNRPPPGGKSDKAPLIHLWITKSPNNT